MANSTRYRISVDYGIRNVLTGCVFWGSLRILWPLKSATHFEVGCVLRIAYCVLTAPYAVHFEVVCVLRIAYCVLAAPLTDCLEAPYVLRITYCVLAAPLTDRLEAPYVLRITYCVFRIGPS